MFPNPHTMHCDTKKRMRARAHRKASDAIEFVYPWEAKERAKHLINGMVVLEQEILSLGPKEELSIKLSLLEDDEDELRSQLSTAIDLQEAFGEYKTQWTCIEKSINDATFDSNGPAIFRIIDEYSIVFDAFVREYESFGQKSKVVSKEDFSEGTVPERPSLQSVMRSVDWKKVLWTGAGLVGLYYATRRPNLGLPSLTSRKTEGPSDEAPRRALETRRALKTKVGPPTPAKTWELDEHVQDAT